MDATLKRDLTGLPNRELEFIITNVTAKKPKGLVTKTALIEKIGALTKEHPEVTDQVNNQVNHLIRNYKFAGRSSISWSIPERTEKELSLTEEKLEELIQQQAGTDVFEHEIKAPITSKPALNRASWLEQNKLLLQFVYAGAPYFEEIGYELEEIQPTRRANALIRLPDGSPVIECRANSKIVSALHGEVSSLLNTHTQVLAFSNGDIASIKNRLKAKKQSAKHKKLAGDFDTVDVKASRSVNDLDDSGTYQNLLGTDALQRVRYTFSFKPTDGSDLDVTIYLNNKGNVWFVSEVPEEVIDYVFSNIKEVKGL
jgi:hypothetical protein